MSFKMNIKHNDIIPDIQKYWTYSDVCETCKSVFGKIFNLQHHCRCCGKSFCWNCCHNNIIIPNIIEIPNEEETYKKSINKLMNVYKNKKNVRDNKKIVCNDCYEKISLLNSANIYLYVFEFFDLKTLKNLMCVSKKFKISASFWISKFKLIMYKNSYTEWEMNMLSSLCIMEHNEWLKTLIKMIIYNKSYGINNKNIRQKNIVIKDVYNECKNICCLERCKKNMDMYDIIEILEYIVICEKTGNLCFWEDLSLRNRVKIIIQRLEYPNNYNINKVLSIIVRVLVDLLQNEYSKIDINFVFVIFDYFLFDREKILFIMNEIEVLKCGLCLMNVLKMYIMEKKINISVDDYNIFKKIRNFFFNIFITKNKDCKKELRENDICYIFDLNSKIMDITMNTMTINNVNCLYLEMEIESNINKRRYKKNIVMKKMENIEEYYKMKNMRIEMEKLFEYYIYKQTVIPKIELCDVIMCDSNIIIIEIPNEYNFMNLRINYENFFRDENKKNIIKNLNFSNEFMEYLSKKLNFRIKDEYKLINQRGIVILFLYEINNDNHYNNCKNIINDEIIKYINMKK